MAGKKRRRTYTFMSQMPLSTQANNEVENVNTNDATISSPTVPLTEPIGVPPSQLDEGESLVESTPFTSGDSDPSTSDAPRKKGRGPAIGYQGKEKIRIFFNKYIQPIGDTTTDLSNLLGEIARCGARAPLDVVSWKLMPATNLDIMWKAVQRKTDAPEIFKKNCMTYISGHWKKWKIRVKSDFFTPNKDDLEKLSIPPTDTRVDPNQWPSLVNYWKREDVEAQSLRNAQNRKHLDFLPRTGRTSHANIREEMKANNEDTSRANVFIKTRTRDDGTILDDDTRILVETMTEKLNEVPELEQTDSFKEQVFTDLMGADGHGRVRTFGTGLSPRDIFGGRSSSTNSTNSTSSDAIKMMVQSQVEAQLEIRVAEQVAKEVAQYEKTQGELVDKIERMHRIMVLNGMVPESPYPETNRSGSSVGQVQTPSNES